MILARATVALVEFPRGRHVWVDETDPRIIAYLNGRQLVPLLDDPWVLPPVSSSGGGLTGIWDIVADGGANPDSLGRDATAAIVNGLAAASAVWITPGVEWNVDPSAGITLGEGQSVFGAPGYASQLGVVKQPGGTWARADLLRCAGDRSSVSDLAFFRPMDDQATVDAAQVLDVAVAKGGAGPPASVQVGSAASSWPTSCFIGAERVMLVRLEGDDGAGTHNVSFTYTSKAAGGGGYELGGVEYVQTANRRYAGPLYAMTTTGSEVVHLYPAYGAAVRATGYATWFSWKRLYASGFLDSYASGDGENMREAIVDFDVATRTVTWVSGDTFEVLDPDGVAAELQALPEWYGLYCAIEGADDENPYLGSHKPGVRVVTYTDNHTLILENGNKHVGTHEALSVTNQTPQDATGVRMVWGGTALTQGGVGGAAYGTLSELNSVQHGHFPMAMYSNFDHSDAGNWKVGLWRFLSAQGEAGWLCCASGVQGSDIKNNGGNDGLVVANLNPNGPAGNDTTNFNVSNLGLESVHTRGWVLGDDPEESIGVCKYVNHSIAQAKLQISKSSLSPPVKCGERGWRVHATGLLITGHRGSDEGPYTGTRTSVFQIDNTGTTVDAVTVQIPDGHERLFALGPNAEAFRIGSRMPLTSNGFKRLVGWVDPADWLTTAGAGNGPGGSAKWDAAQMLPGGHVPSYWVAQLAAGATAFLWLIEVPKKRSLTITVEANLSTGSDPTPRRLTWIVARDNDSAAAPVVFLVSDENGGVVAGMGTGRADPGVSLVASVTNPRGYVALHVTNADGADPMLGPVRTTISGPLVDLMTDDHVAAGVTAVVV